MQGVSGDAQKVCILGVSLAWNTQVDNLHAWTCTPSQKPIYQTSCPLLNLIENTGIQMFYKLERMPHHANYHVLMILISSPLCCKTSPSAEFERITGVGSLKHSHPALVGWRVERISHLVLSWRAKLFTPLLA